MKRSLTYKKTLSINLNDYDKFSLLIPGGCINAFLTLKKYHNPLLYGDYFNPDIQWNKI